MDGALIVVAGVLLALALVAVGCWTFRWWPFGSDVLHVPTSDELTGECSCPERCDRHPLLYGLVAVRYSYYSPERPEIDVYDWKTDGL